MKINREIFFDHVRNDPFDGSLSQEQVEGMNVILQVWETGPIGHDLRHAAYALATTYHETAQRMWPIVEYGKGGDADYAQPDPVTQQCYYGRGFVQLTWSTNYQRVDKRAGLGGRRFVLLAPRQRAQAGARPRSSCSSAWPRAGSGRARRSRNTSMPTTITLTGHARSSTAIRLTRRNGRNGVSIGSLIADYHAAFLMALTAAYANGSEATVEVIIRAPAGVSVVVHHEEI